MVSESPVFYREHFNAMYHLGVYYICKQIADLPLYIGLTSLFCVILYWMAGLNPALDRFFLCLLYTNIMVQAATGFGYMVASLSSTYQVAIALLPPLLVPLMLFSGFYINSQNIPGWLVWLEYVSWFKYSHELLMINQWSGVKIHCEDEGNCLWETGEEILEFYGLKKENQFFDIMMLIAWAVAFRLIGYIALFIKTRIRRGK